MQHRLQKMEILSQTFYNGELHPGQPPSTQNQCVNNMPWGIFLPLVTKSSNYNKVSNNKNLEFDKMYIHNELVNLILKYTKST